MVVVLATDGFISSGDDSMEGSRAATDGFISSGDDTNVLVDGSSMPMPMEVASCYQPGGDDRKVSAKPSIDNMSMQYIDDDNIRKGSISNRQLR